MEMKGLRVNTGKTEIIRMRCQVSRGQVEDSGQFPCDVCREGVGQNSIWWSVKNGFIKGLVASQVD